MRFLAYLTGAVGKNGFGSSTTAQQVTEGIDLSGKVAIVTGSSAGLGAEIARVLSLRGCSVVMAVRSVNKGEKVKEDILKKNPLAKLTVLELDLNSFQSVDDFVSSFKESFTNLNILINNAGVLLRSFQLSKDGYETHFATNHLGHFLLTNRLLPLLKETANSSATESRIVNVASMAHKFLPRGSIQFERNNDEASYNSMSAYGQSKLANILHALELSRRLKEESVENVTVNALCPGAIKTDLQRHLVPAVLLELLLLPYRPFLKSVPQGAATACYVATHPSLENVSGRYFYDCQEGTVGCPEAKDPELAKFLWEYSEDIVSSHLGAGSVAN